MDTYITGNRENKLKVIMGEDSSERAVATVRGLLEEMLGFEVDNTMFGEARLERVKRITSLKGRSQLVIIFGVPGTVTVSQGEEGALFIEFKANDPTRINAINANDGKCTVRLDPDGHAWFPPIQTTMRTWLCRSIGEPHQIIDAMADKMGDR
ncbi:MAG: hypothetical protein V1908_01160, partial [Candidatus Peregrinibacteria bacterium]